MTMEPMFDRANEHISLTCLECGAKAEGDRRTLERERWCETSEPLGAYCPLCIEPSEDDLRASELSVLLDGGDTVRLPTTETPGVIGVDPAYDEPPKRKSRKVELARCMACDAPCATRRRRCNACAELLCARCIKLPCPRHGTPSFWQQVKSWFS